jgi:hypothetical protein
MYVVDTTVTEDGVHVFQGKMHGSSLSEHFKVIPYVLFYIIITVTLQDCLVDIEITDAVLYEFYVFRSGKDANQQGIVG